MRRKAGYLAIGINLAGQKEVLGLWIAQTEVAAGLKSIYTCPTADEAKQRRGEFEAKWDDAYLPISQSWRRNWQRIIPFFD